MDGLHKQCLQMLKDAGAHVARSKTHFVWKLPDGRTWVMPVTPRCPTRAWRNHLAALRRFLGLVRPAKPKRDPKRVAKRNRKLLQPQKGVSRAQLGPLPSMATALRAALGEGDDHAKRPDNAS